ncbi:MAG: hypothetical protein ACM34I_07795 [bacterium]
MKPQEFEKWKKIREKGMIRFILLTGILSYGLPMFVVLNIINPPKEPLSITDILAVFLICAVAGGGVFGYIMWLVQERRYRKAGNS